MSLSMTLWSVRNNSSSSVALTFSPATDADGPSAPPDGAVARDARAAPASAKAAVNKIASPQAIKPCMPSSNSLSTVSARPVGERIRPVAYPPAPNPQRATKSRKRPERSQSQEEESRQVGAVDDTDRPIAEPKASRVMETPAAITAPAKTARH